MTSHETFREQLLELAYGELGRREARALRAHLEGCPECRAELSRMTATRSAMSALSNEPAPERGEAILLAAAREATRDRRRPWLPSWVWGASIGAVGVAAVALLAVRLAGTVRNPVAHDQDALVARSAQEAEAKPAAPAADTASSAAVAAEPAQPAEKAAAEAPAVAGGELRRVAPKPDVAKRKAAQAPARDDWAAKKDEALAEPATQGDALGVLGSPAPAPAPPPMAKAAPPAAPPAQREFARPPPAAAAAPAPEEASRLEDELALQESAPARGAAASASAAGKSVVGTARSRAPEAKGLLAQNAAEDAVARYERLRAAGKLRAASASFPGCPGEASRQVETDDQGRVVKVTRRGVLQGTAYQVEQLYGEDGLLGAVRYRAGGAARELRLGAPGGDLASTAGGIPASMLEPARAAEAGLDAPPRCQE